MFNIDNRLMRLTKLIIFITLIFFLFSFSCDYSNENSNQKSQEKSKKEKDEGIDYFKKKTSESYKKPKDLEDKIKDLFTPDEVFPIRGFARKVKNLLEELIRWNFDVESFKKGDESEKKKEKKQ